MEKKQEIYFLKLRKLERKFVHIYKMHFYLLITTWYILTFELSVQFVRHAFHLWFLLIFYDDVYRWHIPPPCLVSRQIILKSQLSYPTGFGGPHLNKDTAFPLKKRRLRSACASAPCDQIFAVRMKTLRIPGYPQCPTKSLIRLRRCVDWSEFPLGVHAVVPWLNYMHRALRRRTFKQLRTGKALIRLRIRTVWSGPSLSTNEIIGYYRMFRWKANALMRLCRCAE